MNMKKKSIILGILAVTVVASLGIFKAINSSNDKSITKADEVEISSNSQQSSSSDTTAENTEGEGEDGERDGVYNGGEGASIPIRFEEAIAEDGTTVLFPVLDTEATEGEGEKAESKDEGKGTGTVESKPEVAKPKPETQKPKPEVKPESPKPSKPTPPPANNNEMFTEEELRELDEILGLTDPVIDINADASANDGVTGNSFLD